MNTLWKINKTFDDNIDATVLAITLSETLSYKIYSYLLRRVHNTYKCTILISIFEEYNTIDSNDAIRDMLTAFNNKRESVFKQPSLDIQIQLFTPYIQKLAREQQARWRYLEYEDLVQLGYLTMCDLYNKGYYLNNAILRTSYLHRVLQSIRKNRTDYEIISIEQTYGKDDSLSLADTLEDTSIREKEYDNEILDEILSIYAIVKKLIVDMLGERRAEQFINDYSRKFTTNSSRANMTRIKRVFAQKNITLDSLRREL